MFPFPDQYPLYDLESYLGTRFSPGARCYKFESLGGFNHAGFLNRYQKKLVHALSEPSFDGMMESFNSDLERQEALEEAARCLGKDPPTPDAYRKRPHPEINECVFDLSTENVTICVTLSFEFVGWVMTIMSSDLPAMNDLIDKIAEDGFMDEDLAELAPQVPLIQMALFRNFHISLLDMEISECRKMDSDTLSLHYDQGILAMEDQLIDSIQQTASGVHLFRGEPGTGKTSYIKHLCSTLGDRHQFVYVSIAVFPLILSGEGIAFWCDLAYHRVADCKLILVIEDADALIRSRNDEGGRLGESEGDARISDLLNLCDGLLSSVLNFHVIITTNTNNESIDSAVLRPGRLKTYHEFTKLKRSQAQALADHLGNELPIRSEGPESRFSLAEIYQRGGEKFSI